MKKLVLCMLVVSAMFIISCGGGKDWKTSVSGKTFTATNGVSMVFDNDANISLNLGMDNETNEMAKALATGLQNIVFTYIDSPNKTNGIYEIEIMGAKTYAAYSLDGKNLYIFQNDVVTNTNDLNWDETTEEVYILK